MAHWRYRLSQHDSDLPTEPVTLIDLPYTRRYLASTFRAPAPPSEPSDHAVNFIEALASKLAKAPAW